MSLTFIQSNWIISITFSNSELFWIYFQ